MRNRLLGVLALALTVCIIMQAVGHHRDRQSVYNYADTGIYIVQRGDTLWAIAGEYSDERHDVRRVIDIIRTECNDSLTPDIRPGQAITVPLFDCKQGDR